MDFYCTCWIDSLDWLCTGASAQIMSNVGLNVAISGTGGKDQGNETSGHLGVRVGF